MNKCLDDILKFFYKKTGIVFENKLYILENKIVKFYKHINYSDCRDFLMALKNSEKLFQDFVNFLTVSESFFFREKGHFDFVIEEIKKDIKQKYRFLSIPCSSGEEPYTILIYLFENDFRDFEIMGADINTKVIEEAKIGIYTQRRVLYVPKDLLEKYFEKVGKNYMFKDMYKKYITFKYLNLFDKKIFSLGKFDFIFSRNLFIYFDDQSREEALKIFHKLLLPGGYLLLGHADIIKQMPGFERVKIPGLQILKKI
ncbi:CheR family methyltransferase [Nitrosophilus labii]|uniref:CheR family methyltransferase n=1 Tax=Nitrosophilus labii TaxID=2706014 RepID=UPI001656B940|nr:protein-glutamate O-methyltransferase CheR [Nitrosophilus labii]